MDIDGRIDSFVQNGPSRAVVLRSMRGRDLCAQRNADRTFPAASLMKVPLFIALLEQHDATQVVTRSDLSRTAYPSLFEVFDERHEFTLAELGGLMLATSDNPVAVYLTDLVGMEAVTATAARAGAHHTHMRVGFTDNDLGPTARNSITTANDMALILQYAAADPKLQPVIKALRNSMRNFRLPLRLPDDLHVAHKTGSLRGLAHDAGILYGRDHDLIAVFLSEDQPDTATVGIEIGDCIADVWRVLGEPV
ncbi:serine hydrolase [Streptomyces olivaceus]|uniref:serine hydrolase n=1 Tax=Streptomyces TaxID=1883 RepID=UPI0004C99CE0|nr:MULTISPECIES: serine hydrolase [Streptomyces]MBZ6107394.1 class A beta-lactamase-related serine hydrolase [Streptomyces olivaceus]MCU8592141.1 class A beta-lactamase-related serine hydrolase [Streptomyces sp. A13(2022)]